MECSFSGSVKLILFVYGVAVVVSFMVAGIIKSIFAAVSFQLSRVQASVPAAEASVQSRPSSEREG
jgi:hypothetical protein